MHGNHDCDMCLLYLNTTTYTLYLYDRGMIMVIYAWMRKHAQTIDV